MQDPTQKPSNPGFEELHHRFDLDPSTFGNLASSTIRLVAWLIRGIFWIFPTCSRNYCRLCRICSWGAIWTHLSSCFLVSSSFIRRLIEDYSDSLKIYSELYDCEYYRRRSIWTSLCYYSASYTSISVYGHKKYI